MRIIAQFARKNHGVADGKVQIVNVCVNSRLVLDFLAFNANFGGVKGVIFAAIYYFAVDFCGYLA